MQVNRPSLIYSTHGKQGAIRPSTRLTQDEMTLSGVANQHLVGSGGTVNLGQAELAVADRDGSVSFRACRWTRFRLSWLALKPSPRCRALSWLCACAANVALPRVLLKSVVQIATCPIPHMAAELGPDCPGIGIVAVRGDPIRDYAGHGLCRSKEGLGGGKVAVLTQPSRRPGRQRDRSRDTDTANHHAPECMSRRRTSFGRLGLFVADAGSQPMLG